MGTSSLGMLSALCGAFLANWMLAGAVLSVTVILLALGLDLAVKLHHDEVRSFRPQFNLRFSRMNS
jgi:hypothetical protein